MYQVTGFQQNRGVFNCNANAIDTAVVHTYSVLYTEYQNDTFAQVTTNGYFPAYFDITQGNVLVGDLVNIVASDTNGIAQITSINPVIVSVQSGDSNFPNGLRTNSIQPWDGFSNLSIFTQANVPTSVQIGNNVSPYNGSNLLINAINPITGVGGTLLLGNNEGNVAISAATYTTTINSSVAFPNNGSGTLSYFNSVQTTAAFSGPASRTVTLNAIRINNIVTLTVGTFLASTSSGGVFAAPAASIPAGFAPAINVIDYPITVTNNTVVTNGNIGISSNGSMTVYTGYGSGGTFSASGQAGFSQWTIVYSAT